MIVRNDGGENVTYNLTIVTALTNGGALSISDLRTDTNDAEDFLSFVLGCIWNGVLVRGDVLICDNASIHRAAEIVDRLEAAIDAAGVRILFLPTYSPELNPCELCFSKAKSYLRYQRGNRPFAEEVMAGFESITARDIYRFYVSCIDSPLDDQ